MLIRRENISLKKSKGIFYNKKQTIENLYKEKLRVLYLYHYENIYRKKGMTLISGLDEAGRGSLAGPVVASAIVLPLNLFIYNIKDSKKLTPKKRIKIYNKILEKAKDVGIGIVEPTIIDKINIARASFLAMKRAILNLKHKPEYLLVDGFEIPQILIPQLALIKGEDKSISIAAASIVAKVFRDNLMIKYDEEFPHYNLKKNKGYGTKEHFQALRKYGATRIHRRSYKGVCNP
ncbi:MAG: ribonuclease HII [Candidatus Caldatribacteriota bacterium]|nr:ribonuclease HII [Candidatus Caldatribacteriota bacterium]